VSAYLVCLWCAVAVGDLRQGKIVIIFSNMVLIDIALSILHYRYQNIDINKLRLDDFGCGLLRCQQFGRWFSAGLLPCRAPVAVRGLFWVLLVKSLNLCFRTKRKLGDISGFFGG